MKEKYGQYMTPEKIVKFMVSLITKDRDANILEPSAGEGIFLKVLKENGFNNVVAYEIDEDYVNLIQN